VKRNAKLPCTTCCELDITCCKNPIVEWSMYEFTEFMYKNSKYLKKRLDDNTIVVKKISCIKSIVMINPNDTEYCAFYNKSEGKCSIYKYRPTICKSYGISRNNPCPYQDMNKKRLKKLLEKIGKQRCMNMHTQVSMNVDLQLYMKEHLVPRQKSFENLSKENKKLWEELQELDISFK